MWFAYYFSPTTPGAASFSVDITSAVRLGSVSGLAVEAELGATGNSDLTLDDPLGTLGHGTDGIVGLKQFYINETDCPAGNQRLYTGYIGQRDYRRGQNDSLITGPARKIDMHLIDVNDFAGFRVFAPVADDPTSSFDRPAETDIARIAALLNVDFLSDTLFDIGFVNTVGPVAMDANDYTGSRPSDVLNDLSQMSGKNYFIMYWEPTNQLVLWYDKWSSDGSATIAFDSTLRLTNVLSEADQSTTFAITPDAIGTLDPSRVISAIRGTGTGVTGYQTLASTANTFAWRDGSPVSSTVKTQAKMDALLTRYLRENSTEDNRITCTVQVPSTKATLIKAGMRIQAHFSHIPGVQTGFTWCRILSETIRMDQETPFQYWLDLVLSPLSASSCSVSSAIDAYEMHEVLDPYSASGLDFFIPAPSTSPSVMFAAAGVVQAGTSIWYSVHIASPWTLLDSFVVAGDPTDHHLAGVGYYVTPAGTPGAFNINWDKTVEASALTVACTIVTSETAPHQSVPGERDGGSLAVNLTFTNPVTAGNILLIAIATYLFPVGDGSPAGTPGSGIPAGFTQVAYIEDLGGFNNQSIGIWMKCADGSEGTTISVPNNAGHGRQLYLSEWVLS